MSSDVVTLKAGAWTSRWVPSVGMVGVSLFGHGRELLGQLGGLDAYVARGSSFGIPLLHPWANRLSGWSYAVDGTASRWRRARRGCARMATACRSTG